MLPLTETNRARRLLCGSLVSLFVVPLIVSFAWRTYLTSALQAFVISAQAFAVALAWRSWIKRHCADGWSVRWYPETEGVLLLYLGLTAVSAWVTSAGPQSLLWFSGLGAGLLLFLVVPELAAPPEGVRSAVRLLSMGGAVLAAIDIAMWSILWVLPPQPVLSSWHNPNYAALLLVLPWFATFQQLSRPASSFGVAFRFALISTALLMSRSRAVWFGIIIALMGAFLRQRFGRRPLGLPRPWLHRRTAVALCITLAVLIGVTVLAHQTGRPTPADTLATLLEPLEGSAGGRLRRWQNALPMIREHLWFGVGPGRWLDIFPRYVNRIVPDPDRTLLALSAHLGLLAEGGLLAFLAFAAFVGSLLRRRPDEPPEQPALRRALVAFLIAACFHSAFVLRILLIAFWLNLALLAGSRAPTRRIPRRRALWFATATCFAFALGVLFEGRSLLATLHDHIATAHVVYAGDQARLQLPPALGPARSWIEWMFGAAFYRERAQDLRSVSRWAPGKPRHLFLRIAAQELRDGRCDSALQWLKWAEEATTETPEIDRLRCLCETRLGHPQAARGQCEAGLAINDREPSLHLALGNVAVELGEPVLALRAYGRARQLFREHLSAMFGAQAVTAAQAVYSELARATRQEQAARHSYGIEPTPDEILEAIAWTPQAHKLIAVDQSGVYFSSNASGRYQIWHLALTPDRDARAPRLLTNGQRAPFRLRRHPTLPRLYFVADHAGDYAYHVYALDIDVGTSRRLTSGGREAEYEISPDGRWLAFKRERGWRNELCVSDPEGRDERCLTSRPAKKRDLSWHPDSQRLVFVEDDIRLVEARLDPVRERTLLELPGHEIHSPSFDPAGDRLAFVVREPGTLASIQELTLASAERRTLTRRAGDYLSPIWLDAERLLLRENVNDRYELRTLDARDGTMTGLGPRESVIYPVELSADRRQAFFFRSDAQVPIALEQLSLRTGSTEQLLRLDAIQPSEVIPAERLQVPVGEQVLPAYLYVPRRSAPRRGWPCVIWLHGSSSGFSPRWHIYAQYFAQSGFVFVALNFSGSPGLAWQDASPDTLAARQVQELEGLRELLAAREDIDSGRMFLIGVSAGTRVLQDALRSKPDAYAGAVEYSPSADSGWQTPRSDLPPILVFIGDNDSYVNLEARLAQIERQQRLGSRVEVVRYRDEGHDLRGLSATARQLAETVRFLRSIGEEP